MTTRESIDVLDAYGIRVCKSGFATTEEEVVEVGNSIGYPVVMKMTIFLVDFLKIKQKLEY